MVLRTLKSTQGTWQATTAVLLHECNRSRKIALNCYVHLKNNSTETVLKADKSFPLLLQMTSVPPSTAIHIFIFFVHSYSL